MIDLQMNTQVSDTLELLREGPVSPLKAWIVIGSYRLADNILKLRRRGYLIETQIKPFTTSRGRQVRFAEYTLVSEPAK